MAKNTVKKPKYEMEIVAWLPMSTKVLVRGNSGGYYRVDYDLDTCTCPDYARRAWHRCKHIELVLPLVPHRAVLEAAQAVRFAAMNAKEMQELDDLPF